MTASGQVEPIAPDHSRDITIPSLFYDRGTGPDADRIALSVHSSGQETALSWFEYFAEVKRVAMGLVDVGVVRGDKVAIWGVKHPESVIVEMAVLCTGGVVVWIADNSVMDEIRYIVDHSGAKCLVVSGHESIITPALSLLNECAGLQTIITDTIADADDQGSDGVIGFDALGLRGVELEMAAAGTFEELTGRVDGDDCAFISYTADHGVLPKGAMLSHRNVISAAKQLMAVDPCQKTDDYLSYLPVGWIGEQMMTICSSVLVGSTVNFTEHADTRLADLQAVSPTILFAPPRVYGQIMRHALDRYFRAKGLFQPLFNQALSVGQRVAELMLAKKPVPLLLSVYHRIAFHGVLKGLRKQLGLSRLRNAYVAGAALRPSHFYFFHALGVNLKQFYGRTEVTGITAVHRTGDIKFDTVGKPLPGTFIRISPEGRIITTGDTFFGGYHKDPSATAEVTWDGGFASDDKGFFDKDGHLVVFDRTKEIFTLMNGQCFSAHFLETRLKRNQYIKDAWVIGDKRPFIAAIICIDEVMAGKAHDKSKSLSYQALSQMPDVYTLIAEQVLKANEDLPDHMKIKKFINLHKPLETDAGELTRTRKLRRSVVERRYRPLLKAIYANDIFIRYNTSEGVRPEQSGPMGIDLTIRTVAGKSS
ncbi:MAG: AMP-binding protein [Desulfobacteraceae bacterium]|nr:AMP-binding protein [Desulfobacteraceae bacterium]